MKKCLFISIIAILIALLPLNASAQAPSALVIVIEENTAHSTRVTIPSIHDAFQSLLLFNLIPGDVLQAINVVETAFQQVIPDLNLNSYIENQLRSQLAGALKNMLRDMRSQFGLPGSGCLGGILDTIITESPSVGEDIYSVFLDVYGESGMLNCLEELAQPYYDTVELLTDNNASFDMFKRTIKRLHDDGYVMDLLIDVHGCGTDISLNNMDCGTEGLCFYNPSDPGHSDRKDVAAIKALPSDNNGEPFNINAVYMVSCWGSEFNEAWTHIGAKASNGAKQINYYVLMSPLVFLDFFTRGGQTLAKAAELAYTIEKALLNGPSVHINLDLRPELSRLAPIKYESPSPCGVEVMGHCIGLSTRIDYHQNEDYCVGSGFGQDFSIPRTCPVSYSKVIRSGSDTCKQDLLGDFRNAAHWDFDLGFTYGELMDRALAIRYGATASEPVDNKESSRRIPYGDINVRQAEICRNDSLPYCFGAVGMFCGGIPYLPNGEIWGCAGSRCVINAGSIAHDECCYKYPVNGTMCGSIIGDKCNNEWNKALHRTLHRLSWNRKVNTCSANNSGKVNFKEYCALNDTIIAEEDADKCCSKSARKLNEHDKQDMQLIMSQGVILDGTYTPAICISDKIPSPSQQPINPRLPKRPLTK